MIHRISSHPLPKIIKEYLGDEIYDKVQKFLDENPYKTPEHVIYTNDAGEKLFRESLLEEAKRLGYTFNKPLNHGK